MILFRQSFRLLRDNRFPVNVVSSPIKVVYSRGYYSFLFASSTPLKEVTPLTIKPHPSPVNKSFSNGPAPDKLSSSRVIPTGRKVVFYLRWLSDSIKAGQNSAAKILSDPVFNEAIEEMVVNLKNQSLFYNYSITNLCSMYRSLLEIGFDPNHEVIGLLENMILGGLDEASAFDYRLLIGVHGAIAKTRGGKKLFDEISLRMENIISNMTLLDLAALLSPNSSPIPTNFLVKIEQTAATVVSQVTDHSNNLSIYLKFFVLLANNGRRPLPLLHALKAGLKGCDLNDYPDPMHLINVVAALNKLSYPDLLLLQKIESALTANENLKNVKINGISALLTAAGKMNWRCDAILNQISSFIQEESLPFRQQELISFVLASAKLNFKPDLLPDLLNTKILPHLNQLTLTDSSIWLDFVWSLVILDLVQPAHLDSIFNESFTKSLTSNTNPEAKFSRWKLMNILTYARLNDIQIKRDLNLSHFQPPSRSVESTNQGSFTCDILTGFIVRKQDVVTNFESPVGCIIDAEFIANKDAKILPINEYGTHSKPLKELPIGYKRISILGFGFKDLIVNDSSLIGPRRFVVDALNKLKTHVIVIRSNDLNAQMKPVDRVKVLRAKISELF